MGGFPSKKQRNNGTDWVSDHSNDASSSGWWFSDRGGSMVSGNYYDGYRESRFVRGFAGGIDMNNATAQLGNGNANYS